MSQELLEKIRLGYEGFNRGDLSEAKPNVADDVEWGSLEPGPASKASTAGRTRERLSGRGRESGIEVEMQVFSVYWSRAGKIVKRRSFRTRDEALAAL
jgi:ketosteroid isomerase-like protein